MCAHNKPVLLEWVDLCTYFHLTSCQKESGWLSFDINVQRHLPPWTVYIHQQPVVYTIPLLGFRLWSLYITVSDDIVLSLQLTANLVNFLFPIWGVLDCSCYTPQGRRVRQTVRGVGVSPGFFFIWWSWPRWVSWWIAMPVSARYFNEQEEDRLWKKQKTKTKKKLNDALPISIRTRSSMMPFSDELISPLSSHISIPADVVMDHFHYIE